MSLYGVSYVGCNLSADQWLQFDLGPPTLVTGLVTRGRGDTGKKQWVTRYRVSYSNDSLHSVHYKDASHLKPKVSFILVSFANLPPPLLQPCISLPNTNGCLSASVRGPGIADPAEVFWLSRFTVCSYTASMQNRAFSVAGTRVWNDLMIYACSLDYV